MRDAQIFILASARASSTPLGLIFDSKPARAREKEAALATCKKGTVAYECLYPAPCNCSKCCCQGASCGHSCCNQNHTVAYCMSHGLKCTQGGCCNGGRDSSWGYAWKSNDAFGVYLPCGTYATLTSNCFTSYGMQRFDTGPASSTGHIADVTRSLFTQFRPLSKGIITSARVVKSNPCC